MRRLRTKEIPTFKKRALKEQKDKCPLCGRKMDSMDKYNIILDHDHETGKVRGVLCRKCNGVEGLIKKWAVECSSIGTYKEWIVRLGEYLNTDNYTYLHPTHKTKQEAKQANYKKSKSAYRKSKKMNKNKKEITKKATLIAKRAVRKVDFK